MSPAGARGVVAVVVKCVLAVEYTHVETPQLPVSSKSSGDSSKGCFHCPRSVCGEAPNVVSLSRVVEVVVQCRSGRNT